MVFTLTGNFPPSSVAETHALPDRLIVLDCLSPSDPIVTPFINQAPYTNTTRALGQRFELLGEATLPYRIDNIITDVEAILEDFQAINLQSYIITPINELFRDIDSFTPYYSNEVNEALKQLRGASAKFANEDEFTTGELKECFQELKQLADGDLLRRINICVHDLNAYITRSKEIGKAFSQTCDNLTEAKNAFKAVDDVLDKESMKLVYEKLETVLNTLDLFIHHFLTKHTLTEDVNEIRCLLKEVSYPHLTAPAGSEIWLPTEPKEVQQPLEAFEKIDRLLTFLKDGRKVELCTHTVNSLFEKIVRKEVGPSPLLAMIDIPEKLPKPKPVFEWLDIALNSMLEPYKDHILTIREQEFDIKPREYSTSFLNRLLNVFKGIFNVVPEDYSDEHNNILFGDY